MQHEMKQVYGQPGSMEYILRSQLAKSAGGIVKIAPGTAKRILEELNFPGQRTIDSIRQRVQQSVLAWNAFCEGRDLKIIKCITGSPIIVWGTPLNGKDGK